MLSVDSQMFGSTDIGKWSPTGSDYNIVQLSLHVVDTFQYSCLSTCK